MNCNSLTNQVHVENNTFVVNLLIEVVLLSDRIRHSELGELFLNGYLDLDITGIVPFE